MSCKKIIPILAVYLSLFFAAAITFAETPAKSHAVKEKTEHKLPSIYSHGTETIYSNYTTNEITEKSEVKKGKIYFYDRKGNLTRTGNIKSDTVFYDKGVVTKEKISNNKIYQYDKAGNIVGKIYVRPYEIKKILPDGNIEKLKIKIKR